MTAVARPLPAGGFLIPVLIGVCAAAMALRPELAIGILVATGVLCWLVTGAKGWLPLFFGTALLLPPLPSPFGNAGVHVAPFFVLAGMFAGVLRFSEWRAWRGPLPVLFGIFLLVLTGSVGFAALYSGWTIAAGSLARVLLLAVGVFVFLHTFIGPRDFRADPFRFSRFLFLTGSIGAIFACVDFYFQLPAPAGFGAQFIWVGQDVFRRAQGLFYEASTLGNFCAFFLVMILVAFPRPARERPCSRVLLAVGGVFFAGALIFSYSRASLVNVAVAGCALIYVKRMRVRRAALILAASVGSAGVLAWLMLPTLASHYWTRLAVSFQSLGTTPDAVLSGRISSWRVIGDFLLQQPWHLVFGIGYKTLPYTDFVGHGLVADNTWLSLLIETGLVGLGVFVLLNWAILRTALRAARSDKARASFFGGWMFCFWCGEMVQMLSGDLITYWRVLPLYFWVLATAAREAGD